MEDREKAVEKYEQMKKEYGLPELKEIEEELEFEIENDAEITKTIINNIWERVSTVKSYIEGILNPQRYCCLIETKFMNPKEKEKVFDFYKEIMTAYWKTVHSTFGETPDRVKQINDSYEFYKKVKKFAKDYIQRMIKGWSEEDKEKKKEETNY